MLGYVSNQMEIYETIVEEESRAGYASTAESDNAFNSVLCHGARRSRRSARGRIDGRLTSALRRKDDAE
jgi:hypothetical protein